MAQPNAGYKEIAGELRAAINGEETSERLARPLNGKPLAPGSKLPSESVLMEAYEVSRGTVRDALALLRSEGLVEARRGSGVYVRAFRLIPRNATRRLSSNVWGVGRSIWSVDLDEEEPQVRNLVVEEAVPPPHVAACLGLRPGDLAWMRDRDFVTRDRAVQRATSYLPADLVAGSPITQEDTGPGGTYARLADLGHAPVRFREEIKVRMPIADEASRLGLAPGTPVILIARTAFDAEDRPVEVNEMVLDASAYLLQYDFSA